MSTSAVEDFTETHSHGTSEFAARRNGFVGAYLGWVFDGYETYATVLVAGAIVNDLVGAGVARAQPLYIGGILATTLVAWAIGGTVSGIFADYFGRRRALLYSILWYSIFAGLTALAPSYFAFLALRFLTGIGMGAEWGAGSSLVSELWGSEHRGRGLAYLQSAFGVGFLLSAAIWHFVNNGDPAAWRWMYVIGATPAIATLFVRRYVKESKLWLEADAQRRSARRRIDAGADVDRQEVRLARLTLLQLFETAELRRRVSLLLVGALCTTIGWWAVSAWIPQFTGQQLAGKGIDVASAVTAVVLAYNVAAIIGFIALGYLADGIGRKPTMMLYFFGAFISVPLVFLWHGSLPTFIVVAAINGFFTMGLWTWLAIYPTELFPTHMRATAITFVFNTTRLVAAGATLIGAWLIQVFGSISTAAIVVGFVYAIGFLITPWIGPETRGKPLPGIGDIIRQTSGGAA
jgi:MFS family permease